MCMHIYIYIYICMHLYYILSMLQILCKAKNSQMSTPHLFYKTV